MINLPLNDSHWDFVNMNSPADLNAEYEDGFVRLKEYDRCRSGHVLLSKSLYRTASFRLSAAFSDLKDGAGIGLYCGSGAFSNYLYAAVFRDRIEVRIPSGVPNGDQFMLEGPRSHYVLASARIEPLLEPFTVSFETEDGRWLVRVDGREVLAGRMAPIPGLGRHCRAMLKALNDSGVAPTVSVRAGHVRVGEAASGMPLRGVVHGGGRPLPSASVQVVGHHRWALTDEHGRFELPDLPEDGYTLVAGKEGFAFAAVRVEHAEGARHSIELEEEKHAVARTEYPDAEIVSEHPWATLNGTWSFGFDREKRGEREQWHLAPRLPLAIKVPFPWSSLEAFGQSFLADSETLYHAHPFFNSSAVTGGAAWYARTFTVPEHFNAGRHTLLHFNAVSGPARVWVDGRHAGDILDGYSRSTFDLGPLEPGSRHTVAVYVDFARAPHRICLGKQGFWFTESPGIWQSVWLENVEAVRVKEIFADYRLQFDQETAEWAAVAGEVELDAADLPPGADGPNVKIVEAALHPSADARIEVRAPEAGLYKLKLQYAAPKGRVCGEVFRDGHSLGEMVFDCTLDDAMTDTAAFWLQLDAGVHRITIRRREDPAMNGETDARLIGASAVKAPGGVKTAVVLTAPDGTTVPVTTAAPAIRAGRWVVPFHAELAEPVLWRPGRPDMYTIRAELAVGDRPPVAAVRKFGLRLIETAPSPRGDVAGKRFYLNKRPLYLQGIMDQGYNPWGIYTYLHAGDKRGGILNDVRLAETYGYNLIRMHVKDNEPHWYAACDERGMLVWDEAPANFYAKAEDTVWRGMFMRRLRAQQRKHEYHPSVILFSVFNESWGIEGWHERSPWANPESQRWIKETAREYKRRTSGRVLVIDNSGYGKTGETDVIDHHAYPAGYRDSRDFWARLVRQNYPGSTFNFFNANNRRLMQSDAIRDLLQRNCSQPLDRLDFAGEEAQSGQPVLISEFIHTDGQERLLRMFPELSGYTRMNLASQENEDASWVNHERVHRDFGHVDERLEPLDRSLVNTMNAVVIDAPRLSRRQAGGKIEVPVHLALWEPLPKGTVRLEISAVGINGRGGIERLPVKTTAPEIRLYDAYPADFCAFVPPGHWTAAYLFAILRSGDRTVALDSVQFVFDGAAPLPGQAMDVQLDVKRAAVSAERFGGLEGKADAQLAWVYGRGSIEIEAVPSPSQLERLTRSPRARLVLELSSCELLGGVKVTDERKFPSDIVIALNGIELARVTAEDCPYDDRALFSRASAMKGDIFEYRQHSGRGYGYRHILPLRPEHAEAIARRGAVRLTVTALDNGVIVYGRSTGRYGVNPFITTEELS
jgi:hypothetical protein